jgi:hypothetical protein
LSNRDDANEFVDAVEKVSHWIEHNICGLKHGRCASKTKGPRRAERRLLQGPR